MKIDFMTIHGGINKLYEKMSQYEDKDKAEFDITITEGNVQNNQFADVVTLTLSTKREGNHAMGRATAQITRTLEIPAHHEEGKLSCTLTTTVVEKYD